jgi:hypothetical protein
VTTSLTPEAVHQQIEMSAEDRRLKRLWNALPPDQVVREEEAFRLILEAADRYVGDDAWASLQLQVLAAMGAVHAWPGGAVRRSETFPILPDLVPGNAAFEELRQRENAEAREREIASENESYRLQYEASPEGRARREMLALVDERVTDRVNAILDDRVEDLVERHFDELRKELEPAAVRRLRAKWDAATDGAEERVGA